MSTTKKNCIDVKMKESNNRIGYFDILRGIGVMFMIMGHVTFGAEFDLYIHAFHMPIFFFVSGYFFSMDKYENMKQFIVHKMKTLLLPYTVFVLLCQVLHYIYTGDFKFSYFILSYFSSNHNRIDVIGALWFLPCLFSAEVIFYFINKYFKNSKIKFGVIITVTLIGNIITLDLPFCTDSAMSCMLLMYLGYVLKKHSERSFVKKLFNMNYIVLLVLFVINVIFIMKNGMVNIRTNKYSNILLFWFNCLGAIVIYTNIAKKLDCSCNKIIRFVNDKLKYIGKNSLIYLLLNELMIFVANTVCKLCRIDVFIKTYIGVFTNQILVLVLCLILLYVAVEIINKSFLKYFLGKY